MATSEGYREYIADQLSGLDGLSWRAMMGEYILYLDGVIVGGLYDDRLLVKPTASALAMMPLAPREKPYEGAKDMLLVTETDESAFLEALLRAIADELPAPKPKRQKLPQI